MKYASALLSLFCSPPVDFSSLPTASSPPRVPQVSFITSLSLSHIRPPGLSTTHVPLLVLPLSLSLSVCSSLSLYSSSCQSISLNNSLINGLIIILTAPASSSLSLSIPLSISLTDIVIHLINEETKCQIFLLPVFPSPFLHLHHFFPLSLLSHTSTHLPFSSLSSSNLCEHTFFSPFTNHGQIFV